MQNNDESLSMFHFKELILHYALKIDNILGRGFTLVYLLKK